VDRVIVTPVITGPEAPVKEATQSQPPQNAPTDRPTWLPEKFWKEGKPDYEGLAKSYGELERSRSTPPKANLSIEQKPSGELTPKADAQPPKKEEAPAAPPDQTTIPGVSQEQSTKYWGELTQGGKLSDGSYTELEKAGYPKSVVDNYIRGMQADKQSQEAFVGDVKKIAGGDTGYAAMTDWMGQNLTAQEIIDYNEAVQSGKQSVVKLAVQAMHTRYAEAVGGPDPKLLGGKPSGGEAGDVFRSQGEITAAMRDPRYKRDEGYRAEVSNKIARSKV
jgi:hypothetical protein